MHLAACAQCSDSCSCPCSERTWMHPALTIVAHTQVQWISPLPVHTQWLQQGWRWTLVASGCPGNETRKAAGLRSGTLGVHEHRHVCQLLAYSRCELPVARLLRQWDTQVWFQAAVSSSMLIFSMQSYCAILRMLVFWFWLLRWTGIEQHALIELRWAEGTENVASSLEV